MSIEAVTVIRMWILIYQAAEFNKRKEKIRLFTVRHIIMKITWKNSDLHRFFFKVDINLSSDIIRTGPMDI